MEAAKGLPVGGSGVSSSTNPLILAQLDDLKEQNAKLQLISIIAIILAGFSVLFSSLLGCFVLFRSGAKGTPCSDPNPHVPLKEIHTAEANPSPPHKADFALAELERGREVELHEVDIAVNSGSPMNS